MCQFAEVHNLGEGYVFSLYCRFHHVIPNTAGLCHTFPATSKVTLGFSFEKQRENAKGTPEEHDEFPSSCRKLLPQSVSEVGTHLQKSPDVSVEHVSFRGRQCQLLSLLSVAKL